MKYIHDFATFLAAVIAFTPHPDLYLLGLLFALCRFRRLHQHACTKRPTLFVNIGNTEKEMLERKRMAECDAGRRSLHAGECADVKDGKGDVERGRDALAWTVSCALRAHPR